MRKSNAVKAAFCGVLSALCLALMLMSSVIPLLTYTMPALSGILLIIAALSIGGGASWIIYGCVSILSLLFLADKECAVLFVVFFGYYPVLKLKLDGIHGKLLKWFIKFTLFNLAAVLSQLIAIYVLGIPFELMGALGFWSIPVMLLLANLLFVLYDWMLSQLRRAYCLKWHKYMERLLK